MDKRLLSDKFTVDNLPRVCVPRRELNGIFQREAEKRVIFVSAPAGFGKTVSTTQWLSGSGKKTIWINLDSYDNTPFIFYKLLCRGILSVQPDNKVMNDILMSPGFFTSPVENTIRFLSEFIPDNRRYALVLDNTHLITNKELLKSAQLVYKRLPYSFLTLILTRNEIREEYVSSVGEGRCAIITLDDLALSARETQGIFKAHGYPLSLEEAERARSVTKGWAIGVNALAMSGEVEPGQYGSEILDSYIKKQIWDKWDENLRSFMLKTAIVDEMPAELCESLTERRDCRELLEQLYDGNVFISKVSEDTYCYHHLFLDFLRRQISETGIRVEEYYRLVTYYYIGKREYFKARQYATRSGDSNAITNAINQLSIYGSASLDEFVNFTKMYAHETFWENICDEAPFLYATLMWENYLLGKAEKMEYYMDKTYQFLPVIAESFPQNMEIVAIQMSLDHRVPLSLMLERIVEIPLPEAPRDSQQGVTLTHEMPFLHRSNRDYSELADAKLLEKASVSLRPLFKGNLELIIALFEAGLLMEQNLIDQSIAAATHAVSLLNEETGNDLRFSAYVCLTAAYYAKRDARYTDIITETEGFIKSSKAYNLQQNFMAFKTTVALLDGDKKAATMWLDNYYVTDADELELYKIYQYFATTKAYIVLGQTDKAMDYIMKLKKLGSDFNRPLDIAEAGVLQAVVEWACGKKNEARQTLEDALCILQLHGFIRIAAIEGAAVMPILKRINARIKKEGFDGLLEAHFVHKITVAAYEQSKHHKGIAINIRTKPANLSKRQKHILTLLAKGYKYLEIAEETGLSIHTIKSHVMAAYGKLDVHNSIDAVVKAHELGILS